MDIIKLASIFGKVANVKKVTENEYEIVTGAKINFKTPLKIYLRYSGGEVVLCDNKNTLKYMNGIYELKSLDVKSCIGGVVKLYGFAIISGELTAPIKTESSALETLYNYIMCVGQLANMLVFFDKP